MIEGHFTMTKHLGWASHNGKVWAENAVCLELMGRIELNYKRISKEFCVTATEGWAPDLLSGRVVPRNGQDGAGPCHCAAWLHWFLAPRTPAHLQSAIYHLFWMKLLPPRLRITFLALISRDRLWCSLFLTFQHLSLLTTWFFKQIPILAFVLPKLRGLLATIFLVPLLAFILYQIIIYIPPIFYFFKVSVLGPLLI